MKSNFYWAEVSENMAWQQWWPNFLKNKPELKTHEVQKFFGNEVSWGQVNDALFSFSLFKNKRVIVIFQAERLIKKDKKWVDTLLKWAKAPHALVFVSSESAPAHWTYTEWRSHPDDERSDDKAVFRWIDAIHAENIDRALKELQFCLDADQPALVCLQLLSRDFRLGRLIQFAADKGFSEKEIADSLKVPSFAIQKWRKKARRNHRQWLKIFEYLQGADLQLKSNEDSKWTLRILTIKIIRQEMQAKKQGLKVQRNELFIKPSEIFSRPLLPIEPSFS